MSFCQNLLGQARFSAALFGYKARVGAAGAIRRGNVARLLDDKGFELTRHDVTFPLYVEADRRPLAITET